MSKKLKQLNIKISSLDELNIPYIIKLSTSNKIVIRYNKKNILNVLIPQYLPNHEIEHYVNKNLIWIKEHRPVAKVSTRQYIDNETILILGKEYVTKYIIVESNSLSTVNIINNELIIKTNKETNKASALNQFITELAKTYFKQELDKALKVMSQDINVKPNLRIGRYKSRWGMCNIKTKTVTLNIVLIHFPICYLRYVIYHELTHFRYLDHSPLFHTFLQKYIKNERILQRGLRDYDINYY